MPFKAQILNEDYIFLNNEISYEMYKHFSEEKRLSGLTSNWNVFKYLACSSSFK